MTAIIDACRSGTICDLPVIYDADGQARYRNGEKGPPRATSRPHLSAGGCVLFSGSMDHQLSADMTIDVHENGRTRRESFGIMTKSFVDAMVEMCALRDASRYCGVESWSYGTFLQRIRELVKIRAREHLPEYFEKQEPQLSSSHTLDVWNTFFAM